ncbi:PTS fructose transporter subunit IIA [Enterococcus pseudoavium]|uniref:PTS fructose transporter subunit IIA n=1 Tax=Enterococcus pseudoavium TaxID=44007 RepID=A0AAE4I2Q0_9ENTE|nr:PTS fructose transporter subunit IIA [Enterococcus pseudoavium]MDT2737377.1 PTS fructose transporter subunit IIA [Enterococcus pseudoavium]
MKYLLLVSHGKLADGLADALKMLVGPKEEVLSCGLQDGQSVDEFAENFSVLINDIPENSEVVLLGDIIGGSPLTTAMTLLTEKGLAEKLSVIGGMNLPLAVTTALMKDSLTREELVRQVTSEAKEALKEFQLVKEDLEDEI